MKISKDKIRRATLHSAQGQCAFCAWKGSHMGRRLDLEAGHIWSACDKGPYTFWNLLPLCARCNSSKREKHPNGYRIEYLEAILAFYYWSFRNCRHDIALKIVLYKLYEIIVMDDPCKEEEKISAYRLFYHAIWTCRFFGFKRAIEICTKLQDLLIEDNFILKKKNIVEDAIGLLDSGNWKEGVKLIEHFDNSAIMMSSRLLSWRLAQHPGVTQKLIDCFRNEDTFRPTGDRQELNPLSEERKLDSFLRERTSDLLKELYLEDRSKAYEILNELETEIEAIEDGVGCSTSYQRLNILLNNAKLFLKGHPAFKKLHHYSWCHGSCSPIRPLLVPRPVLQGNILAKLTQNTSYSVVNISKTFIPAPGSFAEVTKENPELINEGELVQILNHIGGQLKIKYGVAQPGA